MHQVITVFYPNTAKECNLENTNQKEVNRLLKEGWKVINMQAFSEPVAISKGDGFEESRCYGRYGITFVLEGEELS